MAVNNYEYQELSENLERLEQELLKYEKQIQSKQDSTSTVHYIFRYAHNLKSSLAMVHRQHSSHLIHEIESNYDKIRNGKANPSLELIKVSFLSIDLIKRNLLEDSEDDENMSDLAEILNGICQKSTLNADEKKISALNWNWKNDELSKLNRYSKDGHNFFIMEKIIRRNISLEKYKQLPFFEDIEKVGEIIKITPDFEENLKNSTPENTEAVIQILFTSKQNAADVKKVIFDPFYPIVNDSNMPADKTVKTNSTLNVIHYSKTETFSELKNNGLTTKKTSNSQELGNIFDHEITDYQLLVIESDDGPDTINILQEVSKAEQKREVVPGSLIRRMVISSSPFPEVIEMYFQNLCDILVLKPIDQNILQNELDFLFKNRSNL